MIWLTADSCCRLQAEVLAAGQLSGVVLARGGIGCAGG